MNYSKSFKRIISRTKSYTQSYGELSEDDDIIEPLHLNDESDSSNDTNEIPLTNDEDEATDNEELEHDLPRRNPPRMRNRPLFLRDDVETLLSTGN